MHAVVGIFQTIEDARRGGRAIFRVVPGAHVRIVSPTATGAKIDTLPTDDAEQPGMGAAVGGVVGGAAGAALASLLVPPVGAAALAGIAGGALLGAGAGAVAGDVVEEKLSFGVPHDELLVYEEAVRRSRALVVAATASSEEADAARNALKAAGAQSVDAAREDWAVGLRDAGGE
jgi:hypothetical protein